MKSRKNNPLRSTGKSIKFASKYLAKVVERRAVLAQTKKIGCFIQIRTKTHWIAIFPLIFWF